MSNVTIAVDLAKNVFALANKMARILWAVRKHERAFNGNYLPPAVQAALRPEPPIPRRSRARGGIPPTKRDERDIADRAERNGPPPGQSR